MHDRDDLAAPATTAVRMWLAGEDDEPAGGFLVQKYGRDEARRVATEPALSEDAARQLRDWFTDRLTVDPGVPGPFGNLAYELVNLALDAVDWEAIADEIRSD